MKSKTLFLLKLLVCITFVSRGYQHLFFNVPYREFLWDSNLMLPILDLFKISWNEWVTLPRYDQGIQMGIKFLGLIFTLVGGCVWFLNEKRKWPLYALIGGLVLFTPYLWLHFFGQFLNLALLFEFTGQLAAPVVLIFIYKKGNFTKAFTFLKIAIAITFIAHGLYAMNIAPLPQKFVSMTIKGLGLDQGLAVKFLFWAGVMDLLVAIGVFIPKIRKPALVYMIAWGFLTAFARIYTNFYGYDALHSLHQWVWAFTVRSAHFMIPLILLYQGERKPLPRN